jgi:predicted nucleic acid-binding protein
VRLPDPLRPRADCPLAPAIQRRQMEAHGRESDRRKTPRGCAAFDHVVDADANLTKEAASLKAQHILPYAGCFAAALARSRKAALVTSDKDFERVGSLVKVFWI